MARLQGISGGLSGKTGSYTFRQSRGQTIVSQYQPVVKNPNTEGQQAQRAKFKLMSQLAAVLAASLGTMETTTRAGKQTLTKRNVFIQKNMGLVTTSDTATGIVAQIPMEQVQLTDSYRPFGSINISHNPNSNTMIVTMTASDTKTKGGKIALVGYGTMGVTKRPMLHKTLDFEFVDGVANVNIENITSGEYTVLAYGYQPSEEVLASIELDNIHTPTGQSWLAQINLNQALSNGSVAVTVTQGANISIE